MARFKKGHKFGKGRPKGSRNKVTLEKEKLLAYITQQIIKDKGKWVPALLGKMKEGDVRAIKEGLDRAVGKAQESLDITSDGKEIDGVNIMNIDLSKLKYDDLVKLLAKKATKK